MVFQGPLHLKEVCYENNKEVMAPKSARMFSGITTSARCAVTRSERSLASGEHDVRLVPIKLRGLLNVWPRTTVAQMRTSRKAGSPDIILCGVSCPPAGRSAVSAAAVALQGRLCFLGPAAWEARKKSTCTLQTAHSSPAFVQFLVPVFACGVALASCPCVDADF